MVAVGRRIINVTSFISSIIDGVVGVVGLIGISIFTIHIIIPSIHLSFFVVSLLLASALRL